MKRKEFYTLEDLAELLNLSRNYVYKQWPKWCHKYNWNPIKVNGKGRLLIWRHDVDKMLADWQINVGR